MKFVQIGAIALSFGFATTALANKPINQTIAKSPVVLAGLVGSFEFAEDFKKSTGSPLGTEFIGFRAIAGAGEVEVGVYNLVAVNQASKDLYGCHFHYDTTGKIEDAHCHAEGSKTTFPYSPLGQKFSLEEIETATQQAIELFEKKVALPNLIEEAKIWQASDSLEFSFKWTPTGQAQKASYMMCHYHGSHIDCHRQSQPGAGEPQD